jgi:hypothetical protein
LPIKLGKTLSTKEMATDDWKTHPLRAFLAEELEKGRIPLDAKDMGPMDVWNKYCDDHDDKFEGMNYDKKFTTRLNDLRKQVKREIKRTDRDQEAYDIHRKNFPQQAHDTLGRPNWFGSRAEELLKIDLDAGLFGELKPGELYESRQEYMEFSLDVFRGHIHQSIKTGKFLRTLEKRDEEKKAASAKAREKKKNKAAKKAAKQAADDEDQRGVI